MYYIIIKDKQIVSWVSSVNGGVDDMTRTAKNFEGIAMEVDGLTFDLVSASGGYIYRGINKLEEVANKINEIGDSFK